MIERSIIFENGGGGQTYQKFRHAKYREIIHDKIYLIPIIRYGVIFFMKKKIDNINVG